jgi:hypothetical protein
MNENVIYEVFISAFLPKLKFVYSSAIILLVLHFGNLIILLYKIKLLLILNLTNGSLNSSNSNTYFENYGKDNNYEMVVYNDNFANSSYHNTSTSLYNENKYKEKLLKN